MPKKATKKTAARTKKANRAKSDARQAAATQHLPPPEVKHQLANLSVSLTAAAKTREQRTDAAIVEAAQHKIEKGDHETAGDLLQRVGGWALTHARDHIAIEGAKELQKFLLRLFG